MTVRGIAHCAICIRWCKMRWLRFVRILVPMTTAEFTVQRSWKSDQRSPLLWLWSHIRRNWIWFLGSSLALAGTLLAGAPAVLAEPAFTPCWPTPAAPSPSAAHCLPDCHHADHAACWVARNFSAG